MIAVLALVAALFEPQPLIAGNPYVLPGHQETLTAIAFSPDSTKLASAARDKNVKVWSLETGKELLSVKVGLEQIASLAWSADGKKLAVGDVGLSVQVLEAESGKVLEQLAHPDAVAQVSFQPDGAAVAVAGNADTGAVYELPGGKKRFEFRGRTAQFSADGKLLLVSSSGGSFSLLDAKTGKPKQTVKMTGELPLTVMTPDAKRIASWSMKSGDLKLWGADGKSAGVLKAPAFEKGARPPTVVSAALTADGKRAIVAGADGVLRLYPLEPKDAPVAQRWPADRAQVVLVSPDDTWVAVIDHPAIKLWKLPR